MSNLHDQSYEPSGRIESPDVAEGMLRDISPAIPRSSHPYGDMNDLRYLVDSFDDTVFTKLANSEIPYEFRAFFKTLSIRFDSTSPFEVSELFSVSSEDQEKKNHLINAFEYVVNKIPPVTAGLLGYWISEARIMSFNKYEESYLPDDESWGGMHYPIRREIQVGSDSCSMEFDECSVESSGFFRKGKCTVVHELAHAIHSIYGYYRRRDYNYTYPSEKDSVEHTGCIQPVSISEIQAEFVDTLVRSYARHHHEQYPRSKIRYGYAGTHPAELFACCFEKELVVGSSAFEENPHLRGLFECLV